MLERSRKQRETPTPGSGPVPRREHHRDCASGVGQGTGRGLGAGTAAWHHCGLTNVHMLAWRASLGCPGDGDSSGHPGMYGKTPAKVDLMVDKTLDISKDAQWLLPSEQAIPALLPCMEGAQKRVVRISLWDTRLRCSTSPSSKWAESPPPSCPTGTFLPKHWHGWGVQHQGPTSPSDETPVYMGCPAAHPSPADNHPPGCQCWWYNKTSKAEWETN